MPTPTQTPTGMTLPELLVTLAIFAIAVTTIGPGLYGAMEDSRILSATESLANDMRLTRNEAIRRGHRVMMCAIANGDTSTCTGADTWHTGWMVFADADETGNPTAATDVIRVQDPLPPSIRIQSNFIQDMLYFSPSGRVHTPGNFTVTSTNGSAAARGRRLKWDILRSPNIEYLP